MRSMLALVALLTAAVVVAGCSNAADATKKTDVKSNTNAKPYTVSADEAKEGFVPLFDGLSLNGWIGDVKNHEIKDGTIVCHSSRNIYPAKKYSNFILRLEFKLPPSGNNGVGIRAVQDKDAAYEGMEIQVLDDDAPAYNGKNALHDYQYCCSIYGVAPAKRGHLKPTGEWNVEEIVADGPHIKVTLNGTVVTEADLSTITKTADGAGHPGLHNAEGYVGLLGHGKDPVEFRNIRIKELPEKK
jgi:hypothetical protein